MKSASGGGVVLSRMRLLFYLLLLLSSGCASAYEREIKVGPAGKHDPLADRIFCRDYADIYGVINLSPLMGDAAQNMPDRRQRNRLFIQCMEEKGYSF